MIREPIFLVGAERSGTTLLRLMLAHHPQIAWCNEFEYIVDQINNNNQFPHIKDYQEWLETHRIFQATNFTINQNLTYRELVNSFLLQKKEVEKKEIIGATVHRHFDRLLMIWQDAKFIHLIRDPRDVAKSCIGMGWAGNVWYGIERWQKAEELWNKLQLSLADNKYIEVTYENLISYPQETLTKLCQFMGVEYSRSMLEYPKTTTYKMPDTKFINQWQTKLSDSEIQLMESRINKLLTEKGYQLSGLPLIKLTVLQQTKLALQNWYYKAKFRLKRYGLNLFISDFLSRRLKLNNWQKQVKLQLNKIDTQYLK